MPELVKEKVSQAGLRRAVSDHDASLTVPGAQMVEPAPGSRKFASPVAEGAVMFGKLPKVKFAEC